MVEGQDREHKACGVGVNIRASVLGFRAEGLRSKRILNPKPYTLNPKPYTLHPKPYTLNPIPLNPKTLGFEVFGSSGLTERDGCPDLLPPGS